VKSENVNQKENSGKKKQSKFSKFFNRFSEGVTKVTGGVFAFVAAINDCSFMGSYRTNF